MHSYPYSKSKNFRTAHFRTFGETDEMILPKTTTQAQLESGVIDKTEYREVAKKQINFVTYPMNDFRFNKYEVQEKQIIAPLSTTYKEFFKLQRPLAGKKNSCDVDVLDPLLNRIPKNDFEMLPSSSHKFMDDHLVNLSEGRKKVNFLRQLRYLTNTI